MSDAIDPDEHTNEIGAVRTYEIGRVTRKEARRYARSIEDDNPLFHDLEYARDQGYDDIVVPPNYLPAIIDPTEGAPSKELREDGLEPSRFPIPMPETVVMMGGGQDLMFDRYVVAGDAVHVEEEFVDLYQKNNNELGTLTFLEQEMEFFASKETETDRVRVVKCVETTIIGDRQ